MQMVTKSKLEAEDGRELAEELLRKQLSLQSEGYKITTSMMLSVLMKATRAGYLAIASLGGVNAFQVGDQCCRR